jgi:2-succinyl-5-enolpyruvyl-6-hydroxy-3-cyclohexene-1-carboxylate synthase
MRFQPIYDIAQLCVKKGITQVVLCPGSRCAPLTFAFTRHPQIQTKTISDERSAGFIALGMAQQLAEPVVVVCTSGTAAYNLAPSVAEAFFSQTPLLVLTADRPPEWIAQHDGQTIFQAEIFGKHVKKYYELPADYDHADSAWFINRIINEAINISQQEPPGPVHVNVPFREPLYPSKEEITSYSENVRVIEQHETSYTLSEGQREKLKKEWFGYHHILIVAGQQNADDNLAKTLEQFFQTHDIPIVGDIIGNLQGIERTIRHADLFLGQAPENLKKILKPDLLITFGQSLVSKNVKLFLRAQSPKVHWHIQAGGSVADTFKNITDIFQASPISFFNFLSSLRQPETFENQRQHNYTKLWEIEDRKTHRTLSGFFGEPPLSELEVVHEVLKNLPEECNLHLANSMSVRYANYLGLLEKKNIRVFANRGTSGIDGCTSTSIGHQLTSNKPNLLITGDVAFFYDRNAFWNNYPLPDFRVILLNNHGGLIFNMIDGPASLPETPEYFITRQTLSAKNLCEEFGFEYLKLDNRKKFKNLLKDFFDFDGKTKILELETDVTVNKKIMDDLKLKIKKNYEL